MPVPQVPKAHYLGMGQGTSELWQGILEFSPQGTLGVFKPLLEILRLPGQAREGGYRKTLQLGY